MNLEERIAEIRERVAGGPNEYGQVVIGFFLEALRDERLEIREIPLKAGGGER
jgi:hypothetical protein